MLGSTYTDQTCSIARSLEVVGERWTLLIIRDTFLGIRRFEDIQRDLGIARNVLTARLEHLLEHDVLERRQYQDRPARFEYFLTEKGLGLWPVIHSLMSWGDEFAPSPGGRPTISTHRGCGGELNADRVCQACGELVSSPRQSEAIAGPGAAEGHPLLSKAG
ncbi:putative HTH-type transcriptional regulator [Paraconexibacter sp. AEG42_29]|uniref:HTH-type transcriptional regulator n=1 Tax=Paraconexibacter sp. AEG42_29 TaxID=2997339 RepID=A0AAU7AZJ4_9ACTN